MRVPGLVSSFDPNGCCEDAYDRHRPVLNMHELAVTSGFAAAYRLGANYPFKGDEDCERLFRLYLALSHGTRMVSADIHSQGRRPATKLATTA